jgi:hypothetical protein
MEGQEQSYIWNPETDSGKKIIQNELTNTDIERMHFSFFSHIATCWSKYSNNLPQLRRTMMFYNEFIHGIRYLPEYRVDLSPESSPKDKLTLDNYIKRAFGEDYNSDITDLVYYAWPLRNDCIYFQSGDGYLEPYEATLDEFTQEYGHLYTTPEQIREAWLTDHPRFNGFTTAEEFPEQKEFLDTIRYNSRVQYGIELMNKTYQVDGFSKMQKQRENERLQKEMAEYVEKLVKEKKEKGEW